MLDQILHLPGWVTDISPFRHTPLLPGNGLAVVPLLLLAVVAAALTTAALAGFHHRDLG
jgi:ABC-2 type transport system permease protein